MTITEPKRRAPIIAGQLTGQAQTTKKNVFFLVLSSEIGVTAIIDKLDKSSGTGNVTMFHTKISNVFGFSWEKTTIVNESVVGFNSSFGGISDRKLNEEPKGHMLLRQANPDVQDQSIVIGTAERN